MASNDEIRAQIPQIGPDQIALLERLSNAVGVSGEENEVRALVLEAVKPFAEEVKVDALGNVLVTRKAKTAKKAAVAPLALVAAAAAAPSKTRAPRARKSA